MRSEKEGWTPATPPSTHATIYKPTQPHPSSKLRLFDPMSLLDPPVLIALHEANERNAKTMKTVTRIINKNAPTCDIHLKGPEIWDTIKWVRRIGVGKKKTTT